jgi:TRAP-type C4-dicarboxylate transport system permease small subunit
MLPGRLYRGLALTLSLIVLAFLLLLGWEGIGFVQANWGVPAYTTGIIGLTSAYLAVPVGALTMIIGLLRTMGKDS